MGQKKALILGIAGQDGSYLSELLISEGYQVHGVIRRNSVSEHQKSRLDHLSENITTYYGDISEVSALSSLITRIEPEVIYNLAAQSHVRISFEIPTYTAQTNGLGVLNLLEILRNLDYTGKLYQASSSEMYGKSVDQDGFQRESTPMLPVSPYGISKLFAFNMTKNYRNSYNLWVSNGILFNHESPRRASNFVTTKIIKTAIEIKMGREKNLFLGNLDSMRDWGHSRDYVKAMKMIMDYEKPDDFVVATGETRSVRDLCEYVFNRLNLDYTDFVKTDEKFTRPEELPYLKGDSTRIREILGWKPSISFEDLVEEMIISWAHISNLKLD
jgi:GDPmannose 4,6-dehydratase